MSRSASSASSPSPAPAPARAGGGGRRGRRGGGNGGEGRAGVEDDRRTRGWKGPARPFQPEEERAELLRALRPVDGTFLVHGDPSVTDWTAYTTLLAPLAPGAMAWTAHDPYTEQKRRAAAGLGARAWEIAETPDRSTTRIVSGRMPG
ncbi:cytidyltransferase [Streptomyces sp. NRRL B-3253]|uniref:cytidyltransferase n=1 Tax=Streptomyces sp. NRRL B-3253 TaxID=1463837 RepID=UPI001F19F3CF|nr:cytidyltransferase [Streptomyces sp. NRRL B-3253]